MSLTAQPLTEFEISQRGALVEFISLANPLLVAEFAVILLVSILLVSIRKADRPVGMIKKALWHKQIGTTIEASKSVGNMSCRHTK